MMNPLTTGMWRCISCGREYENQTQVFQCARSHRYDTRPGGFTPPLLPPLENTARSRRWGRPGA